MYTTEHRPLSPVAQSAKDKEPERQALAEDIARFIEGGGRITHLGGYIDRGGQLLDMREGKVPLISFEAIGKRWGVPVRALALTLGKWPSLLYVIVDGQRCYALADIERCEQIENFKIHKASL